MNDEILNLIKELGIISISIDGKLVYKNCELITED